MRKEQNYRNLRSEGKRGGRKRAEEREGATERGRGTGRSGGRRR